MLYLCNTSYTILSTISFVTPESLSVHKLLFDSISTVSFPSDSHATGYTPKPYKP